MQKLVIMTISSEVVHSLDHLQFSIHVKKNNQLSLHCVPSAPRASAAGSRAMRPELASHQISLEEGMGGMRGVLRGEIYNSVTIHLSRLILSTTGGKLAKHTTCGLLKYTIPLSYFPLKNNPSFTFSIPM